MSSSTWLVMWNFVTLVSRVNSKSPWQRPISDVNPTWLYVTQPCYILSTSTSLIWSPAWTNPRRIPKQSGDLYSRFRCLVTRPFLGWNRHGSIPLSTRNILQRFCSADCHRSWWATWITRGKVYCDGERLCCRMFVQTATRTVNLSAITRVFLVLSPPWWGLITFP